jgi:hypothetical protein
MMEAVSTSETSVYYNETTLRNIPEGSNLFKFLFVGYSAEMYLQYFPFVFHLHSLKWLQ